MKAACVLMLGAACSLYGQVPGGVMAGTVADSVRHLPIKGALVTGPNGNRESTAEDGSFTMADLPSGEAQIQIRLTGYRVLNTSVKVAPGALLRQDFELRQMARITGKMIDAETGEPVSRIVRAAGLKPSPGTTPITFGRGNKEGFEIPGLEPGDYTIQIERMSEGAILFDPPEKSKPSRVYGRATYPETIHLAEGEERYVEMRLRPIESHSVSGEVEFPEGLERSPLTLEYIEAGGNSASANLGQRGPGKFRIEGLGAGMYRIAAHLGGKSGFAHGSVPVSVTDHDVEGLRLRISTGVNVTGTLTRAEEDAPPPGIADYLVHLVAADPSRGRHSDPIDIENGRFHAEGLAQGDYWLTIPPLPEGYAVARVLFQDVNTEDRPIPLQSSGEITVVITSKPGAIAGTIRDGDQTPVKDTMVELRPESGNPDTKWSMKSGAGGDFSFPNLPPGKYRIKGAAPIEVKPGETASVAVKAER